MVLILGALKRTDSGIFSVPLTRMSEQTIALQFEEMESKLVTTEELPKKSSLAKTSSKDSGMLSG